MRWDWFMPALGDEETSNTGLAGASRRIMRRAVPKSWFSDATSGRLGRVRRGLQRIGPSWESAPLRRVIQSSCLMLFFALFLYVCWPYTAQPVVRWQNWLPTEVDVQQGRITLEAVGEENELPQVGQVIYVGEGDSSEPRNLGQFRVAGADSGRLTLEPADTFSDAQWDDIAASFGPWTLSSDEPGKWPSHYADDLARKERVPAELLLAMDPLVSLTTALAARAWVWSLVVAAVVLVVCLVVPRAFCSYACPLGTLIDFFDWALFNRIRRWRIGDIGWWVHIKYYLLAALVVGALMGVLLSGYVAAIPVVTRGFAFILSPLELGSLRGWHQVPAINSGHVVSLVLLASVFLLGLFRPRFWCKYVCPTGAMFSVGNLLRVSERKVEDTCIDCGQCVEVCPFDAIKADFTTRGADCTYCQTCGGVCPTYAIKFVSRWNDDDLKDADDPPLGETSVGRRGFLAWGTGILAGAAGGAALAVATKVSAPSAEAAELPLVRPPGSVPEPQFLELCIRCGECFQACPNSVLQPAGFKQGLTNLWTPRVVADWSGCEPSCSNCGQVCPTGAIRALPLDEKRVARMGLAVVNETTCLPFVANEACQLCVDECNTAGYEAIEFVRVGGELGPFGEPAEDSGFLAPVVVAERCVGCGLCQTRCYAINVKSKGLLPESAIVIEAGDGKEDRLMSGSYVALRDEEQRKREESSSFDGRSNDGDGGYLPDFLK